MTAATLLDRLDTKQTGAGRWMARCPAHEDRSPSLSIRELDDGRVLVWCFAGCAASDVVAALGLQMGDLFPEPLGHHIRPVRSRIPALDLLQLIDNQAMTVALIAADFLEHRAIDEPTWQTLAIAAHRIGRARDMVRP